LRFCIKDNQSFFLNASSDFGRDTFVSFFRDGKFDSFTLGEGDVGFVGFSNYEDVVQPSRKDVTHGVLDVDNVKRARVTLSAHYGPHTPQITTSSDHTQVTRVEFDGVNDFPGPNVDLDGVIRLDQRVRVADRPPVIRHEEWDALGPHADALHLAQLVLSLLISDPMDGESSLDVVDESEVLPRLLDLNDVHEPCRIRRIGSHLPIHLDKSLHEDLGDLLLGECILESVPEEDDKGE